MTPGRPALCDDAPWGEVLTLGVLGNVRHLARMIRQGQLLGWGALVDVVVVGAAGLLVTGAWWGALLATAMLFAVVCAGPVVPLALARAGWQGRGLLVERSPAGRAIAVVRPRRDADGSACWHLSDLLSVPARGARAAVDRASRPGARLVRRAAEQARELGVGIRLKVGHRDLAGKLYEPAGFVYDSPADAERRQPRMHLLERPHAQTGRPRGHQQPG